MATFGILARRYSRLAHYSLNVPIHSLTMAASLSLLFTAGTSITTPQGSIGLILLVCAALHGLFFRPFTRYQMWTLALAAIIVLSGIIVAMVNHLVFGIHALNTLVSLVWPAMLALIIVANPNVAQVVKWLFGLAAAQTVAVIYQGIVLGTRHASGLTDSPNPSAGLMALFAVLLMPTRLWPLSILAMMGMAFSASRWAILVMLGVLLLMVLTRHVPWHRPVIAIIAAALLLTFWYGMIQGQVIRTNHGSIAADIEVRMEARQGTARILVPNGYAVSDPAHNVPLQLFMEYGVPAMLAWLVMSFRGWKVHRETALRWAALATLGFGVMDYYIWLGPLAWAWWLLISASPGPALVCDKNFRA